MTTGGMNLLLQEYVAKYRVKGEAHRDAFMWIEFIEKNQVQFLLTIKGKNYVIMHRSIKIDPDGHSYMYIFGRQKMFHEATFRQSSSLAYIYEQFWMTCIEEMTYEDICVGQQLIHLNEHRLFPDTWFVPHIPVIVRVNITSNLMMASSM